MRERDRALAIENRIAQARARGGFETLAAETERLYLATREEEATIARAHRQADYAVLCFVLGREAEALRLAREALDRTRLAPLLAERLRTTLGWLLLRAGLREEARALAESLRSSAAGSDLLEETEAQIEIQLGVLRGLAGERAAGAAAAREGFRALEALLSPRDPRLDWAREAVALLE